MRRKTCMLLAIALSVLSASLQAMELTDTITAGKTGITTTNYQDMKPVTFTSTAVYTGYINCHNNWIIMKRSKGNDNNTGIVTTASGGKLKSITFTITSTNAKSILRVYGNNSAYTSVNDLYNNSAQGALLASETIGTRTTIIVTPEDSYSFLGICSNNGAIAFEKIEVQWETEDAPHAPLIIDENVSTNRITPGETDVQLFRTFNTNAWNSLVLPFSMSAEQVTKTFGDGVKVAKYLGTTTNADGTYTLNFEPSATITAHEPVMIYGVTTSSPYLIGQATVTEGTPVTLPQQSRAEAGYSFVGSYDRMRAGAGEWFISSDNRFYRAIGTENIKPTRAVFHPLTSAAAAKGMRFDIVNGATGIATIECEDAITPAYNLSGQRVGSDYRGIVIRNGKKYINR